MTRSLGIAVVALMSAPALADGSVDVSLRRAGQRSVPYLEIRGDRDSNGVTVTVEDSAVVVRGDATTAVRGRTVHAFTGAPPAVRFVGDDGNDSLLLDGVVGDLTFLGGQDEDRLQIGKDGGAGRLDFEGGPGSDTLLKSENGVFTDLLELVIDGGSGNENVTIPRLRIAGGLSADLGTGDDRLRIGGGSVGGDVFIDGGPGMDRHVLDYMEVAGGVDVRDEDSKDYLEFHGCRLLRLLDLDRAPGIRWVALSKATLESSARIRASVVYATHTTVRGDLDVDHTTGPRTVGWLHMYMDRVDGSLNVRGGRSANHVDMYDCDVAGNLGIHVARGNQWGSHIDLLKSRLGSCDVALSDAPDETLIFGTTIRGTSRIVLNGGDDESFFRRSANDPLNDFQGTLTVDAGSGKDAVTAAYHVVVPMSIRPLGFESFR
jgi:hypothetical protein